MTSIGPAWFASPPEVHSALLRSGPGPAGLLAAAGAWSSMSTEYAAIADELASALGAVQAGGWQGSSADAYVTAHAPYLAWLAQAGAHSAEAAVQHQAAATAYSTALAAMPTPAELTLNHTTRQVLVATNFFGINTIPIAVNEADYLRMWTQAATTMSSYQAVAEAVLVAVPHTPPPPTLVKSGDAAPAGYSPAADSGYFTDMFDQVIRLIEHPVRTLDQIMNDFATDPAAAWHTWRPLVDFTVANLIGWPTFLFIITIPVRIPIFIPLLVFGINEWLALLPAERAPADGTATESPGSTADSTGQQSATTAPAVQLRPMAMGPGSAGSVPAAPGMLSDTGSVTATGGSAPTASTFGYLIRGADHPSDRCGPTLTERGGVKSPAVGIPAAATTTRAPTPQQARARRRPAKRKQKDFADESIGIRPDAEVTQSDRGVEQPGLAGTLHRVHSAPQTGLATLDANSFGAGPTVPMIPGTWADGAGPAGPLTPAPRTAR